MRAWTWSTSSTPSPHCNIARASTSPGSRISVGSISSGTGRAIGQPILVRPRMGQGHFKHAVAAAYRHRCAVTRSATFPSLEAAHIRPFAEGGEHAVSNGLLLRTDVHRLYDRGYLSVDADLRLRVSPQLRDHGWNGAEFYEREAAGFVIPAPSAADHRPNRDALAWHFETQFRAA